MHHFLALEFCLSVLTSTLALYQCITHDCETVLLQGIHETHNTAVINLWKAQVCLVTIAGDSVYYDNPFPPKHTILHEVCVLCI